MEKKTEVKAEEKAVFSMETLKGALKELQAEEKATKKVVENRQKKVNVSETEEDKAKLAKAEKKLHTVRFFKALAEGNKEKAIEVSKASWGGSYTKSLNTTNDSALVPVEFATDLLKNMETYSEIRQNASVRTMSSKSMDLNELLTKVSVAKVAEGSDLTVSEPTFDAPTITAESYMGGTDWTYQFEDDEELDGGIVRELLEQFAEQFALAEQASFLNSAVSGAEGIMTVTGVSTHIIGDSLGTNAASGSTAFTDLTAKDVHDAKVRLATLGRSRVANAKLYISPDVLNVIATKFTSSVGYGELPLVGMTNGEITSIAGLPVVLIGEGQLPELSDSAVTTKFAFIADLKKTFIIGDRKGVEFDILNQGTVGAVNLNLTGGKFLRGLKRTGQQVVLNSNIMMLLTSTT